MAQSQVPFTYLNDGQEIINHLSDKRFGTYLQRAGFNKDYAFELYLYNARLAKAFLFPLQILEVTVRNTINELLIQKFGENYFFNQDFIDILNEYSEGSLKKAISRAKTNKNCDIVSTLTFDFWSNLFRDEYDRPLWQINLHSIFPKHISRKDIKTELESLNHLRNRIAHHEPILDLNLSNLYSRLLNFLDMISENIRKWVQHYGTVNEMLRTKPSSKGGKGPLFQDRCDSNFHIISENLSINQLPQKAFLLYKKDKIESVFEKSDIALYVLALSNEDCELIVDLNDIKIEDVLASLRLKSNFQICGGNESFAISNQLFKSERVKFLVVCDKSDVIGIIKKSHRRY